jgi:hypothetical protein
LGLEAAYLLQVLQILQEELALQSELPRLEAVPLEEHQKLQAVR